VLRHGQQVGIAAILVVTEMRSYAKTSRHYHDHGSLIGPDP
jgi:hypothetical protein